MNKTYSTNEIVALAGRDANNVLKLMKAQGSKPLSIHKTKTRTYRVWSKEDGDKLIELVKATREKAAPMPPAPVLDKPTKLPGNLFDLMDWQHQLDRIEAMVTAIYNDLYKKGG